MLALPLGRGLWYRSRPVLRLDQSRKVYVLPHSAGWMTRVRVSSVRSLSKCGQQNG